MYLSDVLAHVPGGRAIVNTLMSWYLKFFRWLLSLLGIEFTPPQWIKSLAGIAPPAACADGEHDALVAALDPSVVAAGIVPLAEGGLWLSLQTMPRWSPDGKVLVAKTYERTVTPADDGLTALAQAFAGAARDVFKSFVDDIAAQI